ncbi:alpha/beta hydrolase [Bradyrhizobium manausense]|uniref:alpha/beta hydrolase n=1 Tax=Bradyrhizobium manausense TaxID=989370 RepID=UPI001BA6E748|nr:alpha/beta hydrolase [Bradyrhizobium manausense]MBR0726602.1 alpha/beta hydrolase [Bradyrhizobium manausense]
MHLRHPRVANSIITAFALLTLGVARPASAEEKTIKGGVPINLATLQPGVTYTDIPNGFARPHLMMDIIKPVSDKPVPAIVFVSGNGWRSIDRAALIPQLSPIAKAGYLVAAIDYRIIGEANFPKPLEDVKTAIRFLRANAKIYNIDPDHIAVWGNSAGGHLSAMAATTGEIKDYDSDRWPGQSSAVQAAVIFYGPMDLSHRMDSNAVNGSPGMSVESAFLGFDAKDPANAEKVKKANPVAQISDKTPPMLIVHGTKDVVVPISESENLYAGLTAAKRPATFIRVEGAGHSFGQVSSNPEVMAEVLAFFDRTLKGKP